MKFLKSLLLAVALVMPINASVFVTNNLAASTNHFLISGAFVLQSLQIYTTNATPSVVKIFDGLPYYDNTQYTNYSTYKTNYTSSVITSTGVTNTVTNTTLYVLPATVAAARNFATPRFAVAVDSLNPVTITPSGGFEVFSSRLTADVGAAGVSIIAVYRSP